MDFPKTLKICRQSKKLTQKQMAEHLGMTERGYQNYELGRGEPTYKNLVFIADILSVSTDYLLGRTDNPEINR